MFLRTGFFLFFVFSVCGTTPTECSSQLNSLRPDLPWAQVIQLPLKALELNRKFQSRLAAQMGVVRIFLVSDLLSVYFGDNPVTTGCPYRPDRVAASRLLYFTNLPEGLREQIHRRFRAKLRVWRPWQEIKNLSLQEKQQLAIDYLSSYPSLPYPDQNAVIAKFRKHQIESFAHLIALTFEEFAMRNIYRASLVKDLLLDLGLSFKMPPPEASHRHLNWKKTVQHTIPRALELRGIYTIGQVQEQMANLPEKEVLWQMKIDPGRYQEIKRVLKDYEVQRH